MEVVPVPTFWSFYRQSSCNLLAIQTTCHEEGSLLDGDSFWLPFYTASCTWEGQRDRSLNSTRPCFGSNEQHWILAWFGTRWQWGIVCCLWKWLWTVRHYSPTHFRSSRHISWTISLEWIKSAPVFDYVRLGSPLHLSGPVTFEIVTRKPRLFDGWPSWMRPHVLERVSPFLLAKNGKRRETLCSILWVLPEE